MGVKRWSGTKIVVFILACWAVAAYAFATAEVNLDTRQPNNALGIPAAVLFFLVLLCQLVVTTTWAWNRREVEGWHWGKLLILWAVVGGLALLFGQDQPALSGLPLACAGIPALVLTWAWLTGREQPRGDNGGDKPG